MELRDYQLVAIDEIRAAFKTNIRRVCYTAPCGSGKGVLVAFMARKAAANGKNVLFLINRKELLDQVKEDIGEPNNNIQLVTVQSIVRKLDKIPVPDLIISDEFHHGVAATWRKIFDKFNKAYLVGLTATPIRTGNGGLGDICDKLIIGPSVKQLIAQKYLAPYKWFAPEMPIDLSEVKIKLGDYDQTEIAVIMDRPHVTGKAVEHYKKLADGKQAIVYCANIQHSKNTAEAFRTSGYNSVHVDGETPAEERKQAIADFKSGKLTIMTNVMLFSEGLNLPNVEVAILLRPTQSLILHLQQCMRPMRYMPGKTAIIIDAVGNVFRHGLPDYPHQWSLDGTTRRSTGEKSIGCRRCPRCFACIPPAPKCYLCGYEFTVTPRMLAIEAGELKQYDEKIIEDEKKHKRMQVGMCRTQRELAEIEISEGYKKGWAFAKCKAKQINWSWKQYYDDVKNIRG